MLARTAASLLGLLVVAGPAPAQEPPSRGWQLPSFLGKRNESRAGEAGPTKTLSFHKEAKTLYFTKDPVIVVPPAPTLPPMPATIQPAAAVAAPLLPEAARIAVSTSPPVIMPVAMQKIDGTDPGGPVNPDSFSVQLNPPGPQRLFRLESERSLQERMQQENRQRPGSAQQRLEFPPEPDIAQGKRFLMRDWSQLHEVVEPAYVCYGRLLFEDRNSERYGWDLGAVQPFVSLALSWKDALLLPYHRATDPCRCHDCNTGYCLPGDPVPYVLYPPGLSVTGTVAEAVVLIGIAAMFP